jgi:hypothetical protein
MITAILLVGLTAIAQQPTPSPEMPASTGFSGNWERDPGRSDDAQEKMKAAFQRMQEEMERRGRGGFPGGGPPPGGPPAEGPPPGGSPPGGRRATPGRVPEELEIEHEKGELRLDDGERLNIFYLDGKKHRREMPNGAKLETVATLQGGVVLIEEKLERGKIERKLELSEDGKALVMTLNIKLGNMKEPVLIRTVYERVESGESGALLHRPRA